MHWWRSSSFSRNWGQKSSHRVSRFTALLKMSVKFPSLLSCELGGGMEEAMKALHTDGLLFFWGRTRPVVFSADSTSCRFCFGSEIPVTLSDPRCDLWMPHCLRHQSDLFLNAPGLLTPSPLEVVSWLSAALTSETGVDWLRAGGGNPRSITEVLYLKAQ